MVGSDAAATVKVAAAVRPVTVSVTFKVMMAVPCAAGVTVTVGAKPVPPTTTPEAGTMVRFPDDAVKARGSPPAPPTITNNAPVFPGKTTVWLAGGMMVGSASAVTVNVAEALSPVTVSVAVKVITLEPAAAGVTVKVGKVTVPPIWISAFGTTDVFPDEAESDSLSPLAPPTDTGRAPVLPGRTTV